MLVSLRHGVPLRLALFPGWGGGQGYLPHREGTWARSATQSLARPLISGSVTPVHPAQLLPSAWLHSFAARATLFSSTSGTPQEFKDFGSAGGGELFSLFPRKRSSFLTLLFNPTWARKQILVQHMAQVEREGKTRFSQHACSAGPEPEPRVSPSSAKRQSCRGPVPTWPSEAVWPGCSSAQPASHPEGRGSPDVGCVSCGSSRRSPRSRPRRLTHSLFRGTCTRSAPPCPRLVLI